MQPTVPALRRPSEGTDKMDAAGVGPSRSRARHRREGTAQWRVSVQLHVRIRREIGRCEDEVVDCEQEQGGDVTPLARERAEGRPVEHRRAAAATHASPSCRRSARIAIARPAFSGIASSRRSSCSNAWRDRTCDSVALDARCCFFSVSAASSLRHASTSRFGGTGILWPSGQHATPNAEHGTSPTCCVGRRTASRHSKQTQDELALAQAPCRRDVSGQFAFRATAGRRDCSRQASIGPGQGSLRGAAKNGRSDKI